jgi:hypothetical protein
MKITLIRIFLEVLAFFVAIGLGQDLLKWKEKREGFVGPTVFTIALIFYILINIISYWI